MLISKLIMLIWLRFVRAYLAGGFAGFADRWRFVVGIILQGASWVIVLTSAFYAGSIVYGLIIGEALPTATLLRRPSFEWLTVLEPFVGVGLLVFAAFGVLFAHIGRWDSSWRDSMRQTECALTRLWSRCGLPVIVCFLLFSVSSGGWSGHIRLEDLNYMSFGGLLPYSDANAYFTAALEQPIFGEWNHVAARRPLAAALRQLTVWASPISLGWNTYIGTLVVQLALLAVLLTMAARSVARMNGIWAGIAFAGAIYMLGRQYLPTTMTESLGLAWALLSIVFFTEAFRLRSAQYALVALGALTFALGTRMGSLLTLPILALWIAFAFARSSGDRAMLFLWACGVFIAVIGTSTLLTLLYGPAGALTGGNFAFTLCGLSNGLGWDSCYIKYAAELSSLNERDQAWFLLAKAWETFQRQPNILLQTTLANLKQFIVESPSWLMTGAFKEDQDTSWLVSLALLPGFVYSLRSRCSYLERLFWLSVFVSAALSAAIILKEGRRAMLVTDVLMVWFLALGFTAPTVITLRDNLVRRRRWQTGAAVLVLIAGMFILAPAFSHALIERELALHGPVGPPTENVHILAGGKRISGFLVIPDEADGDCSVPALRWRKFVELIQMIGLEAEFGAFLKDLAGKSPFAFITGVRFDVGNQQLVYIAPSKLIEERDALAWRLTLLPLQPNSSAIFRRVATAEKIP
jgi:hypothetical protein